MGRWGDLDDPPRCECVEEPYYPPAEAMPPEPTPQYEIEDGLGESWIALLSTVECVPKNCSNKYRAQGGFEAVEGLSFIHYATMLTAPDDASEELQACGESEREQVNIDYTIEHEMLHVNAFLHPINWATIN